MVKAGLAMYPDLTAIGRGETEGKRWVSIQQRGRVCVGSFTHANTRHPQAEEAERQKGNGTAAHKSKMGGKCSSCNYSKVRFKYMTATPEAMHGVKLKIERQGMKCHFGRPDRARSCPYERSHAAHLTGVPGDGGIARALPLPGCHCRRWEAMQRCELSLK